MFNTFQVIIIQNENQLCFGKIISFSSPKLKARVSFSDHFLSSIHLSICLSVTFLRFQLLNSQEPLDRFQLNLGEEDSCLLK